MGRGSRCASSAQYGTSPSADVGEAIFRCAEWPRTTSPEVLGDIADDRSAARPAARSDRRQRLLRRGRVRAGAQPARQDRAARQGGGERRRGRDRAARQDRRLAVRLPGRGDDGLDRDRLPRRALAGQAPGARLRRPLARGRRGHLAGDRLLAGHRRPHRVGEQVPKMLAISHAERTARRVARPLNWFRAVTAPVVFGAERALQRDRPPLRGQSRRPRRAPYGRGPEADHRQLAAGGDARPRRGRDARRRLPPARAGGARGDDADPRRGHRRRLGDRRDGAAALRHLRPHAAGGDRGRKPRPGEGDRPQQQPRPALHERRARGLDRAGDPRRADRPRDEAAR